jgi:hypothetical protein
MIDPFMLLFWLLVGHAVADFSLQSDSMVRGKNRHRRTEPPPGAKYQPTWYYWLSAHALIHGGAVGLITGFWLLGLAETVAHWIVDFGKCENLYGVHEDQFLHVLAKVAWWALVLTV